MKIVFFIQSLSSGGAERVTATLANYWAARGWDVTVVTVAASERDFYELEGSVSRIPMGLDTHSGHWVRALFENMRRVLVLRKLLNEVRPDVAVAMMPRANSILALAGRLAGVSTVGSERIYPPAIPLGAIWEAVRRRAYRLLSALVAQTNDAADWLHANAPAPRIAVIPNPVRYPLPVSAPRMPPVETTGTLAGERVLLSVGRLEEQKGFDLLLEAFAKAVSVHPEWSLVILGQGRLGSMLAEKAVELGVGDRVALPGVVGNVGEWFEAADAYVLASHFEGFPNTLLEAMAHGLPSIAVDCRTGPADIIEDKVNGLLVPEYDSEELIRALDWIMGDDSLRIRLSAHALEVRQRFAVETIAEQWEAVFQDVTSQT